MANKLAETYHRLSTRMRRIIAIVGLLASIATVYTMVNQFFGVNIRPTWHWESQHLYEGQTDILLRVLRLERRTNSRELETLKNEREQYWRNGTPVPSRLSDDIADAESDQKKLDDEISAALQRLGELDNMLDSSSVQE